MPIPDYESLMPYVLRLATNEQRIRDAVENISDQLRGIDHCKGAGSYRSCRPLSPK